MKKIYLLSAFLMAALLSFGQNDSISHNVTTYIVNDTLVWVSLDYSDNCPEAGTGLTGLDSVAMHSGANDWASVVAFDSTSALIGLNDGRDNFRVLINPKEYYGVDFASLNNIFFIFNYYLQDANAPWDHSTRDSTNSTGPFAGDCSDPRVTIEDIPPLPKTSLNVSGCKDMTNGTVEIKFNYNANCPEAEGTLAGVDTIGFHSGANSWASVVGWDDPGRRVAVNNGLDTFTVVVETQSYYGIALGDLENIKMVFNNGPNDGAAPWDNTGRADQINPTEACEDLHLEIAELPECATEVLGIQEYQLEIGLKVAPNPFGEITNVSFTNFNRETLTAQLTNVNGQVVRDFGVLNGNSFQIERRDLASGMYFLTVRNEEGKIAMEKLMLK